MCGKHNLYHTFTVILGAVTYLLVALGCSSSGRDWLCVCQDGSDEVRIVITNESKREAKRLCLDYIENDILGYDFSCNLEKFK